MSPIQLTDVSFSGEKDSMIFDCVECYDPITKQWTTAASMTQPRCGLGVCACHGAIYAMGEPYILQCAKTAL